MLLHVTTPRRHLCDLLVDFVICNSTADKGFAVALAAKLWLSNKTLQAFTQVG